MDEILFCLAILQMVVWCFFFLMEIPKMTLRQLIKKDLAGECDALGGQHSLDHTARLEG